MSKLVGAVKTYAYMDRGELVEVDLHEGLETTLAVLGHKLKHTDDRGRCATTTATLPKLTVRGSELNQVWTNLLDNAIDALGERGHDHDPHPPRRRLRGGRDRRRRPGHPAPRCASACSSRSSPPRTSARAPASASPPPGGSSSTATTARSRVDSRARRAPRSTSACPLSEPNGDCHDEPAARISTTSTITELPESVDGCEDCLATGGEWLHLRICLECGHVGCCDDSPNRHATGHAHATEHPIIRSLEPGEEWCWCFVDELGMLIPQVQGETRIPPSPMLS